MSDSKPPNPTPRVDKVITITFLGIPADCWGNFAQAIEEIAALSLIAGGDAITETQELEHVRIPNDPDDPEQNPFA